MASKKIVIVEETITNILQLYKEDLPNIRNSFRIDCTRDKINLLESILRNAQPLPDLIRPMLNDAFLAGKETAIAHAYDPPVIREQDFNVSKEFYLYLRTKDL